MTTGIMQTAPKLQQYPGEGVLNVMSASYTLIVMQYRDCELCYHRLSCGLYSLTMYQYGLLSNIDQYYINENLDKT